MCYINSNFVLCTHSKLIITTIASIQYPSVSHLVHILLRVGPTYTFLMIRKFSRSMMDFSPQILLSNKNREQCIQNIKELPAFVHENVTTVETAAVLIPLCIVNGEVSLLYTLRSTNLKHHSGQVSFPGGRTDGSESPRMTALRETDEELGILQSDIDVWTEMPQFQGATKNILITPVIGVIKEYNKAKLNPNPNEVSDVFTVPIQHFCNPDIQGHLMIKNIMLPVFSHKQYTIWGLTGLFTHIFLMNFLPPKMYNINLLGKQYEFKELIQSKL